MKTEERADELEELWEQSEKPRKLSHLQCAECEPMRDGVPIMLCGRTFVGRPAVTTLGRLRLLKTLCRECAEVRFCSRCGGRFR